MSYVIKQELCSACHRCRTGCPVDAIRFQNAKYWIDPEKCISCSACVKVCHNGCIYDGEAEEKEAEKHEKLVKSCDVCVVGGGGSGLVAANKALDEGNSVIVLEKMHEVGGSSWYAGGFRVHWCKGAEKLGLADEREKKYQEFMEKLPDTDPKLLKRMFWANENFADWLIEKHHMLDSYEVKAGQMGPFPPSPMFIANYEWKDASKRIDRMIGPGEIGSFMAERMQEDFLKNGGELLLKTSGKKLLLDEEGSVCGLLAEDEGGEIEIHAKAVVLAAGAFSRNKELMKKFAPLFYDDEGKEKVHIFTGAGCTGDGISMCEEIGADIDYVNRRVNMFGPMRHPYPCASMAVFQNQDGFEVDCDGNAFQGQMGTEVSALTKTSRWFGYKIVDDKICRTAIEEAMQEPPQSEGMDLPAFQKNWREVFAQEAEDQAIIIADSLEELAEKCDFADKQAFLDQVKAYNKSTKEPRVFPPDFPEFMKPKHDAIPLEEGPFYAIKMKMFHENSIGGMVIDENASVLKEKKPIPGLYACGDTTRGIMGHGDICVDYLESVFSSLTMAYNEGYIAGTEAANYCKK